MQLADRCSNIIRLLLIVVHGGLSRDIVVPLAAKLICNCNFCDVVLVMVVVPSLICESAVDRRGYIDDAVVEEHWIVSLKDVPLPQLCHRLGPGLSLVNRMAGLTEKFQFYVSLCHLICLLVNAFNPLVATCHVQLAAHHSQLLQIFCLLTLMPQCLTDF